MIFYLGNKVDKVNKTIRLNRNMEKSWDYGYDASIDTVIISKDGTLGEIYNVCGLNIGLPAIPEKEMIKNWDKTHINQKWKRDELPAGLTADTMKNSQYRDYIKQQFEYRANGYWVYLNGVPVYLTGIYWFFIQWVRIEEDYPNLRIIQNELMIFWEACKADSRSYGMQYVKNRRIGASSLAVAELLFSGTTFHDKELGIISKTGDDASDIFQRIVTSFRRLPPFFQPMTDSGSDNPKTVMVFREPSKKGNTKGPLSESKGLNTTIEHYSTTKNAMDGKRIFRSLIDECFAPGTKILMEDMSFKNIEDINIGDTVIVEGGKKVKVAKTMKGQDNMFLVKQPYSKDYIVSSKHRLYLEQRCKVNGINDDGEKIMTPEEAMNLSKYRKRTTFGVRSKGLDLPKQEVLIDPYILGMWLGDGSKDQPIFAVNTKDVENYKSLKDYAEKNDLLVSIRKTTSPNCEKVCFIRSNNDSKSNKFNSFLEHYKIRGNKSIPAEYFNNDFETRLNLLAGLLDTDGSFVNRNNTCFYELSSSKEDMFYDYVKLARSLGFKVDYRVYKTNLDTIAYKMKISGDVSIIPCRIERKKCPKDFKRQYASHINKIEIEPIGIGEYYGIQLEAYNDDDRRLILEDFTLSMNCGKFPSSVPFDKYWSVVKTSHQKGRVIFGKSMAVSTVNAMKDGGAEFKNIWDNSDVNERNDNDMTISGLYRIFIPAKYCLEGFFDQYGFSIVKDPESKILADDGTYVKIGSETYLKNVLESLKHKPEEYNEQLRQFPDTPKDAFRDVTDGCAFNLIHLQEQIDFNQIELNDKFYADTNDLRKKQSYFGNDQVMRGNFRWRGGVKDTVPEWYPDKENGRFYILKDCLPNEEDRGKKVWKRTISGTGWTPTMSHIGCFGVDPYDRSFTSDGRGSKGAIHLVTRTSASHYPNDTFILEYIDRPKSIDIFIEDVIMAMVFFSMPVLPEMSNIVLLKTLKDRGYRNFVVNNPLKKISELKPNELDLGGFPQQGKGGQDAQYTILEKYIEDHVGVGRDGAERGAGVMGTMPFTRTLIQWKDVDLNDRTDFDAYISGSLALLGLNTAPKIKEVKQVEKFSLFPQYDNTGQISKIVC